MNTRIDGAPPDPALVRRLLAKMADDVDSDTDTPRICVEARKFFCGDADQREWTDQQDMAMLVVNTLVAAFMRVGPHGPSLPPEIVECAKALREPTLTKRRIRAMVAIGEAAKRLHFEQRFRMKSGVPTGKSAAVALIQQLESTTFFPDDKERDFDVSQLWDDIPGLVEKLSVFALNTRGKKGAKSAPTILAELIVEMNGGFGFKLDHNVGDEDEIERIRKALDTDWRTFMDAKSQTGRPRVSRKKSRMKHKRS